MASPLLSLHRRIHATLDAAIADRSLPPGAILLEAVIADALLTSRTPVNVALEQLRRESRVAKLEGRGYVVLDKDGRTPARTLRIDRRRFAALAPADAFGGRAPAAWSRIYHEVETQVAGGALYGELRIVEVEVAKAFGVSRTVAREVLSRIERAGLIVKDDRSFWRTLPLTAERTTHIYEIRRALEPVALRRAAEGGHHAGAGAMRDRLRAARARLPDVAPEEVWAFERELHVDLLGTCGNPEIIKALRVGQLQLAANRELFDNVVVHFPLIIGDHLGIADRLAADDVAGAVEALVAHLDDARAVMVDHISALADAPQPALPLYLQRDEEQPNRRGPQAAT